MSDEDKEGDALEAEKDVAAAAMLQKVGLDAAKITQCVALLRDIYYPNDKSTFECIANAMVVDPDEESVTEYCLCVC